MSERLPTWGVGVLAEVFISHTSSRGFEHLILCWQARVEVHSIKKDHFKKCRHAAALALSCRAQGQTIYRSVAYLGNKGICQSV